MDQQELISWAGVIFGLIICSASLLLALASIFKISRREGRWTFDVEVQIDRVFGAIILFWLGITVMRWGVEYGQRVL